jgi:hypothetical protein
VSKETKVVLHWKDTVSGEQGHGEPIDRAVAEAWAEEIRSMSDQYEVWLEEVEA